MRKFSLDYPRRAALVVGLALCLAVHASSAPASPAAPVTADETPDASPAAALSRREEVTAIANSLHYQQGQVTLGDGLAKLAVPSKFRYLGPEDAGKVLHDLWGNPPGSRVLGLILPVDVGPLDQAGWAVVVTYDAQGYVKDDEAKTTDYNKLLEQMKVSTREANKERVAQGYPAAELVGWAAPPRYDPVAKKIYWAKELRFQDRDENTLNYNIRILGRHGVLVLNAIAGMSQLPEIEQAAPSILSMVDFKEGNRYADFNPKTDKVAAIGIAALVAGGVAMKMGLFKGLLVAALAAKKFVIIGVVALSAWIKRLFGAGREKRM